MDAQTFHFIEKSGARKRESDSCTRQLIRMSQYISVKVHPGARKDMLLSNGAGRFEAWVRAKPIEGRATKAVLDLLAVALRVPNSRLHLVKGMSYRNKVFQLLE